jgi:hypothetical protein
VGSEGAQPDTLTNEEDTTATPVLDLLASMTADSLEAEGDL